VLGIADPIPGLSGDAYDALPLPGAEASAPGDAHEDAFLLPEAERDSLIAADARESGLGVNPDTSDSGGSVSDGESEPAADGDTGPDGSTSADGSSDSESGVDADAGQPPPPIGLAIGAPMPIPQAVGNASGTDYRDICPGGQVVIGYVGKLNNSNGYHVQIQALCGKINLTGSGPWNITTTTGTVLPMRGGSGSAPWSEVCPANQMVVGFMAKFMQRIDTLSFSCAGLVVSSDGSMISEGTVTALPLVGTGVTTTTVRSSCPTGSVATVSNFNAGVALNVFGIECSSISLTY
jgi:hypothetical protein